MLYPQIEVAHFEKLPKRMRDLPAKRSHGGQLDRNNVICRSRKAVRLRGFFVYSIAVPPFEP